MQSQHSNPEPFAARPRKGQAAAFFAAKESLWRGIWRRGICRHIFRFDWEVPDWHAGYAQATKATRIQSAESSLAQV